MFLWGYLFFGGAPFYDKIYTFINISSVTLEMSLFHEVIFFDLFAVGTKY